MMKEMWDDLGSTLSSVLLFGWWHDKMHKEQGNTRKSIKNDRQSTHINKSPATEFQRVG
jgi:hypothetical protein